MKILQEVEKHIKIDAEIEKFFYEECNTYTFEKGKLISKQNHYNRIFFCRRYAENVLLRKRKRHYQQFLF
jgi:hypothetical protein